MKPRAYHSPQRAAGAARTRQAIVEAAVRLHARGITSLSAVAEAAGVSLPTVTKHFATREHLFDACTRHAATTTEYPSPERIAAIANDNERVEAAVRGAYELNEATMGLCWTGYHLAGESPAMAGAMTAYEEVIRAIAGAALSRIHVDTGTRGFVTALLGPLAYRALRVTAGLSPGEAIRNSTQTIVRLLNIPS